MTRLATCDPALGGAASRALGLAASAARRFVSFGAPEWTVRCLTIGRAFRAAALPLGRFSLVAVTLAGLVQLGSGPLIAGLVVLMLMRQALLRRIGGVPTGGGP